jgi:hypothetical protein
VSTQQEETLFIYIGLDTYRLLYFPWGSLRCISTMQHIHVSHLMFLEVYTLQQKVDPTPQFNGSCSH